MKKTLLIIALIIVVVGVPFISYRLQQNAIESAIRNAQPAEPKLGAMLLTGTITAASSTVTAAGTTVRSAKPVREWIRISNVGPAAIYCNLSATAPTIPTGLPLNTSSTQGWFWDSRGSDISWDGAISCTGAATSTVSIIEK